MSDDPRSLPESPLPAPAWDGLGDTPPLEVLERDVRYLMNALAEARLDAEEARRAQGDEYDAHLRGLLEVLDAFDRVFLAIHRKQDQVDRQMKIWIGNFRSVKRLLEAALEDQGIQPMQDMTGSFDPRWHKAVDAAVDPSKPDGTILEVVRRGFVRNGALFRKAEVVVVNNDT